ncbi:hypothetical protein V8G54_005011, partial [Vigna mungo]
FHVPEPLVFVDATTTLSTEFSFSISGNGDDVLILQRKAFRCSTKPKSIMFVSLLQAKGENTQPCFPCTGSGAQKCKFCLGSGNVTVELGGGEKEVSICINCDGVCSLTCTTCQGSRIQPRYLDRKYAVLQPHFPSFAQRSAFFTSSQQKISGPAPFPLPLINAKVSREWRRVTEGLAAASVMLASCFSVVTQKRFGMVLR